MDIVAKMVLAMGVALVCAFSIGWFLANTGGMWRKKYEVINGREKGFALPHRVLATVGLGAIFISGLVNFLSAIRH